MPRRAVTTILVACALMALSVTRVFGGPAVPPDGLSGPEVPVSNPVRSPAWNGQDSSAAAWDGREYLVVWEDHRMTPDKLPANIRDPDYYYDPGRDIFGAKVGPNGRVLDAVGFPIAAAPFRQGRPRVAWSGSMFLVVWEDHHPGTRGDVIAARVKPDGTVLDPGGIAIAKGPDAQYRADVAWGGGTFIVVYSHSGGSSQIEAKRIGTDGVVLDPGPIGITPGGQSAFDGVVGWNGTEFIVGWVHDLTFDTDEMRVARVSASGVVLDPGGTSVCPCDAYIFDPAIASDGSGSSLLVWAYQTFPRTVVAVLLDQAARPTGDVVSLPAEFWDAHPRVAWNGSAYQMVWINASSQIQEVMGARVGSDGSLLSGPATLHPATQDHTSWGAAVASGGDASLVTWHDSRSGSLDVYGTPVDAGGTPSIADGIVLSRSANAQFSAAVATDGDGSLVAWADGRAPRLHIYAGRVDAGGVALDGSGIRVSGTSGTQDSPSVAFDGTNYLIVWISLVGGEFEVQAARVDRSGTLLDPTPITVVSGGHARADPAVAWNGSEYLVVWSSRPLGLFQDDNVQGVLVDPAGHLVGTPFPISAHRYNERNPDVAWDGQNFVVVWEDHRHEGGPEVFGARVAADGLVLDRAGFAVATGYGGHLDPSVASNGSEALVTWTEMVQGETNVRGARIGPDATLLDPNGLDVSTAHRTQDHPDAAWDGMNFLVAWRDARSGRSDVYGSKVSEGGVVLNPQGVALATAGTPEGRVSVAPVSMGRAMVAYDRFVAGVPFGAERVFLRFTVE